MPSHNHLVRKVGFGLLSLTLIALVSGPVHLHAAASGDARRWIDHSIMFLEEEEYGLDREEDGEVHRGDLKWYNTVLHSHSTYSDGNLSVQLLMMYAALSGCDAIAITDHNTLDQCSDPYFEPFLGSTPVRGEEWSNNGHANILGLTGNEAILGGSIEQMIEEATERGGIVNINHPFLSSLWPHDYLDEGIDGIEVWNSLWLVPPVDCRGKIGSSNLCPEAYLHRSGYLEDCIAAAAALPPADEVSADLFEDYPNPLALAWWQGSWRKGTVFPQSEVPISITSRSRCSSPSPASPRRQTIPGTSSTPSVRAA